MALIRDQLRTAAKRIVVKVGSAIITDDKGHLSVPRLGGVVGQLAYLRKQGRQPLLVTSGSVAYGRKRIDGEIEKSKTVHGKHRAGPQDLNRLAASVGQPRLLGFYTSLFDQYQLEVAQFLVTKDDFQNEQKKKQLRNTLLNLLDYRILPILNTNDAVEISVMQNMNDGDIDLRKADMEDIILEDNDSLAAIVAAEINSDLLIMLSNVDGVYSGSPDEGTSRFISTYTPNLTDTIEFGSKSSVGLGGMQAKVRSALWASKRGTSVVICNGSTPGIITQVVNGDKVGTFFTQEVDEEESANLIESSRDGSRKILPEVLNVVESANLADLARDGSQKLLSVGADVRSQIIADIGQALEDNKREILAANELDLKKAKDDGLEDVLLARLKLTDDKLKTLADGIGQIAVKSKDLVERTLREIEMSDTIRLRQISCPFGVLMVIFESRPDCLPQITSLSIATANGLLLKGGKEAAQSNRCLYNIIKLVLAKYDCQDAIQLVDTREQVSELLKRDSCIDLIIPRGSNLLVKSIQKQADTVPVLGHAEGICHVYIDQDADPKKAIRIVIDSKCNYPAACNAMETLLIHRSIVDTDLFTKLCEELKAKQVKINIGSRLAKLLPHRTDPTSNYKVEYGRLECTVEVVDSIFEAIDHIKKFGSGHTDAIVTENEQAAMQFRQRVDSACKIWNGSTRFSDGYRFGLGAEVGISTSKIHARGPAGMESLLTYYWFCESRDDVVEDYEGHGCSKKYTHKEIY